MLFLKQISSREQDPDKRIRIQKNMHKNNENMGISLITSDVSVYFQQWVLFVTPSTWLSFHKQFLFYFSIANSLPSLAMFEVFGYGPTPLSTRLGHEKCVWLSVWGKGPTLVQYKTKEADNWLGKYCFHLYGAVIKHISEIS